MPRPTLLPLLLAACLAPAGVANTVSTILYYDNDEGPNAGGNISVPTFVYSDSLTDPATGVAFDIAVTLTPSGGLLITNGGTVHREFGIDGPSDVSNSLDTVGETITASLTSLTITDFGGNAPGDVSVSFDGFTQVVAYYVGDDSESGEFRDGAGNLLFEWNGSLASANPDASGAPFVYGVPGQSSVSTNVATIDLSGALPSSLVAIYTEYSGAGTPTTTNSWRVDDYGVQFTVDVLQRDPIVLLVSPTGMTLLGGTPENGVDRVIDYLEIRSESGSLVPGGYTGIGGDPAYPAGSGVGDGWELGENNSAGLIVESYLLGESTIGIGDELSMGNGFANGGLRDLTFAYLESGKSELSVGVVEYVLPGDFNDDGLVNAADYTVWRDNLGGDESALASNGDRSGTVDIGDYLAWRENFGLSWGTPAATAAAPEPASLGLLGAALLSLAGLRRRRLAVPPVKAVAPVKGGGDACLAPRGAGPLLAVIATGLLCTTAAATPNIVFIMADDLGWSDTSNSITNLGNPSDYYETPTLERLAAEGMAFTNAYTNGANCAPTRAALLTGQFAARPTNNVFNVGDLNRGGSGTLLVGPDQGLPSGVDGIPNAAYTYAEMLQAASYRTAHFGKFHVVDSGTAADDIVNFHGFHENYGGKSDGGPGSYHASGGEFGGSISPSLDAYAQNYTQQYVDENIKPYANGTSLAQIDNLVGGNKHVSDALADAAIDFMEREKGGPFMMQFHPFAVHTPIGNTQARDDLLHKYQNKQAGAMDSNASFGALIEGLDQSVARLVDYLEATPDPNAPGQMLADNTILFFYSDNGGQRPQSNNGPLKNEKGEYDEGGIRVPLIAWSANPTLVDGATVNHTPVQTIDFYKTFAAIAGAPEPAGVTLDGEDLTGILADSHASLGREDLFWHFPGYLSGNGRDQLPQSVIRSGDWKLFYNYEDQTYELYNLASDIGESNDLAGNAANKGVLAEMALKLMLWLKSTDAPLATLRSGSMILPFEGAYYADGKVQLSTGSLSVGAGDEAPLVLGDLISLADLDRDGEVLPADWQQFKMGQGADLTGMGLLEAFAMGDLDGDQDNDVHDFILYKSAYELANGAGSFAELLAAPEPASAALIAFAAGLLGCRRRRG